jgi:hypothetical protein
MFPYKKIFALREFRSQIDGQKFSWHLAVLCLVGMIIVISTGFLGFGGIENVFALSGALSSLYLPTILVLVLYAFIRTLAIRIGLVLLAGYLVKENVGVVKNSSITLWHMVNTYLYAYFIASCVQIIVMLLATLSPNMLLLPLVPIAWLLTPLFDTVVAGLAAYWIYQRLETEKSKGVVQGEVVQE